MIELNKKYKFKEEFAQMIGISNNSVERRLDDLLEWLKNFYVYEFIKGRPYIIIIKEIIGEYQPLPRKKPVQDELNRQKQEDYDNYTIASLTPEYRPNSKSKVARKAINKFGQKKYGHTNVKYIANSFVKRAFDQYGETNNSRIWVYYESYYPLSDEDLGAWMRILKDKQIDVEQAANSFYVLAEGGDISKELNYYKMAKEEFEKTYGDFPILVSEWRLKS